MTPSEPDEATGRTNSAAQTRAKLIAHGRVAFAAKGHDNVSLHRDVLGPAGVSNGSFYHQFRDKTDLLVAVLEDGRERGRAIIQQGVDDSPGTPPVERMTQRIGIYLGLLDEGEDMFRIMLRERDNDDERVRTLLADFRTGSFAPTAQRLSALMASRVDGFDSDRAMTFIRGLIETASLRYLDLPVEQREAERDELARNLAAFIIGGLTGMAGIPNRSGVATT